MVDRAVPGPTVRLDEVETPVALIDGARMQANARRVVDYCTRHDLAWRPHIKTHKSVAVARRQLAAGARGLTVATPREAEVMSAVTDDLLLAYPPVGPARVARVVGVEAADLKVALDSPEVLRPLAQAARTAGRRIGVLVEIDLGLGRVGVQSLDRLVALADEVAGTEGVDYRGILFYAGHIRTPGPEADAALVRLSAELGKRLEALAARGLAPAIVSGGTTPTLWRSHEIAGLTEIRAGTCIFNDRDALSVGAAGSDDLAYSVLATVVSTEIAGHAAIDAGSKALAKEPRGGAGTFGFVLGRPDVEVVALSEEHGVLDLARTAWRPTVGERVRIVPNHVCVSVNLQDRLLVLAGGDDDVAEVWPIEARGRGPWNPQGVDE